MLLGTLGDATTGGSAASARSLALHGMPQPPERMIVVARTTQDTGWLHLQFGDIPVAVYQAVVNLTAHRERCPQGAIADPLAHTVRVMMHINMQDAVLARCSALAFEQTHRWYACPSGMQVSGRTGRLIATHMHFMMWGGRQVGSAHACFLATLRQPCWHDIIVPMVVAQDVLASPCRGIPTIHRRLLGCIAVFNAVPSCAQVGLWPQLCLILT